MSHDHTPPAPSQTAVEPVAELVARVLSRLIYPVDTSINPRGWEFRETPMLEEAVRYLQEDAVSALTAQAAALVAAEKERDEARSKFNDIDLCQNGAAPCEWSLKLIARAEAAESEVATLKARIAELEAGLAFYASKANYADVPLQQWFRENEGKDAPTGYRCGNIDISAKPGHAIAPIFADLGDLARRLTHQEKNNG